VIRFWRLSRSTVRFADLSIFEGVTSSKQSQTFGSQRYVDYYITQYKSFHVCSLFIASVDQRGHIFTYYVMCCLQFLSHPLLSELLTEEDQKVSYYFFGAKLISVY
jgi:hypothetical protein